MATYVRAVPRDQRLIVEAGHDGGFSAVFRSERREDGAPRRRRLRRDDDAADDAAEAVPASVWNEIGESR